MAISLSEVKNDASETQEVFEITDKKQEYGNLYYRVIGDQGTELTYKNETFMNDLDADKIEFIDEEETKFTIQRNSEFNLWD